jgi:hypothetical protein
MGENRMAENPRDRLKTFPMQPHHEISETFSDCLGLAMFDGNTLRLEFAVSRLNEPKPPNATAGERHTVARLVLSAPCAVDLINQMQMIASQLAQAGLIKTDQEKGKPQTNPN